MERKDKIIHSFFGMVFLIKLDDAKGVDVSDREWSIELDAYGHVSVLGELEEEEKNTVAEVLED